MTTFSKGITNPELNNFANATRPCSNWQEQILTVTVPKAYKAFLFLLIFLSFNLNSNSQGLLKKAKEKLNGVVNNAVNTRRDKVERAIDSTVDEILNGSLSNSNILTGKSSNGRPNLSELRDEDFNKNSGNPIYDEKNTRIPIAKNLMIDIKGKYPNNYLPKWRFISYTSALKFAREDWVNPSPNLVYQDKDIAIGDYGGKAVIWLKPYYNCECYADIIVKEDFAVITETPKIFELGNFRKILNGLSTGEPCISGWTGYAAWRGQGGWGGKITLSTNNNGDILINDFMLEQYTADYQDRKKFIPSQVNYRFRAKGITVENEMSPEKANGIVKAEQEAKQKQKDYLNKTIKQADSLQKVITKKYTQKECKSCFYSSSGSYLTSQQVDYYYVESGDYARTKTEWGLNIKTEIKNKCSYDIKFIGIQQLYDEERGYYLKEVTKIMPANYEYNSNQGAMASLFTALLNGGSEFNIKLQDKYYPSYASVGNIQWIKVVKK